MKIKKLTKYFNKFVGKKYLKSLLFLIIFISFFWKLDLIHNQVIYTNLFLIFSSIFLYERTNKVMYLFGWLFVYILNELLYILFNFDLYYSGARTDLIYTGADTLDRLFNYKGDTVDSSMYHIDRNLTESIFKGKKCISSREGEKNRFDYFIDILDIKKGDSVLDCGCGRGDLVGYLRKKGINAYGITISIEQYKDNKKKYGDYYYWGDYAHFRKEFVNRFDHILCTGSLEHPFSGNPNHVSSYKTKYEKMSKMFNMFKKYYKKDSNQKKLFTNTLHQYNPNHPLLNTMRNKTIMYFTERMFGGLYPLYKKYGVKDSMKDAGYKVIRQEDRTWDYYYTSYCDILHFGNPYNINPIYMLLSFPFNQFAFHTWVYWKYGMWMWMFSNRLHTRRDEDEKICDPNKSCDLYYEEDKSKRPASLLYTIAQCK
ncbi:MAG: hypothetical protein CML42_00365 [Rhodobacteraceae bacterium]|nr:hypothetical protein [Paracoccaceae bacterium]|tara:strand:+ start:12705 stop:13985 length:1281 start_codon:yes stop_codon:yes gene_type:complete